MLVGPNDHDEVEVEAGEIQVAVEVAERQVVAVVEVEVEEVNERMARQDFCCRFPEIQQAMQGNRE